jgi:hypothetical protein
VQLDLLILLVRLRSEKLYQLKSKLVSKLVVRVLSYVPGKCITVIVVNWAKIGRSMKDLNGFEFSAMSTPTFGEK